MQILVINSGSSSLKFQLIRMDNEQVLMKGICDKIGLEDSFIKYKNAYSNEFFETVGIKNHREAMEFVIKALTDETNGVIKDVSEIGAVGHRIVQGGEKYNEPVIVDGKVLEDIKNLAEIAPLHNHAHAMGIEACMDTMPGVPMVVVFDNAFHHTMPKHAFLYALPYEVYEKYKVRKYGFHGTSHKYVAGRAAVLLGRPLHDLKLVTCHLGNGASVCAVKSGKSIDTSMGFTPLEGLAMGTRSGSLDPAVIPFLIRKGVLSADEIDNYLNKKSGMLGISGISRDFRDLQAAVDNGHEMAILALDIFCYRVKMYIGAYSASMGGIDAVIFTAGIGENMPYVREKSLFEMEYLGIEVDKGKNNMAVGGEFDISTDNAKVRTLVIPTNEELAIARETLRLVGN